MPAKILLGRLGLHCPATPIAVSVESTFQMQGPLSTAPMENNLKTWKGPRLTVRNPTKTAKINVL
jgi:hypothetical protein